MGQKFWSCVRDVCAVRGDCYSAPLHVQFKPVTPDPVVRNSVLTHWYFRISNWFFFFLPLFVKQRPPGITCYKK